MSYILDALQKSETERQSQLAPETYRLSRPQEAENNNVTRWLLLLCLLTLLAAGLSILWFIWTPQNTIAVDSQSTDKPVFVPTSTEPDVPKPSATVSTASEEAMSSKVRSSTVRSSKVRSSTAIPSELAAPATKPEQGTSSPQTASDAVSDRSITAKSVKTEKTAQPASVQQAMADSAIKTENKRIHTMAELPAAVRSAMPSLAFSFHVYASDPSRRTIIINGRRLREGQSLNKDIRLLNITPEGVELMFRNYRVALPVINHW